jgi:hypothetical protein
VKCDNRFQPLRQRMRPSGCHATRAGNAPADIAGFVPNVWQRESRRMRTKKCKLCKKEKPVTEFYRTYVTAKGTVIYRAACIECHRPVVAQHLREKRIADPEWAENNRARQRSRYVLGSRNEYHKQYKEKRKAAQGGWQEDNVCTCNPECPVGCKGQCGCVRCKNDYADFLSME